VREFVSDKRASIAILFAFALVPLVTFVGAAVDYSRAANAKERLTAIADAVVLEAMSAAALPTLWNLPDYGKAQAEGHFVNQARSIPDLSLDTPRVVITQTSNTRTVSLEYSGTIRNVFGSILKPTTLLKGSVTSSKSLTYMDFYLLLDNSPSMGLGATPTDISTLENNTSDRCAFACHESNRPTSDYYTLAKSLGVTMRMDVVRQATQKLIDTATATQALPGQFRVGIFTFSDALRQVSPLTANLGAAKTAAGAIDITTIPQQGFNDDRYTDFDSLLAYMSYIPSGGTGSSSSSPRTILFLVSDGVADEPTPGNPSGRTIKPIPLALCNQIKSRNIQIAALYTTYYPLPNNSFYRDNVAPFVSQLGPTMQACASPDLYFEVSPSQGISEAMQALFQKAVGQARLTQ
jgi:hypothetical protein